MHGQRTLNDNDDDDDDDEEACSWTSTDVDVFNIYSAFCRMFA
jgi:hypothetical protein